MGALHYGKHESEEAVDSEDVEKEVVVVVGVVCSDTCVFKCLHPLSGKPVHPKLSSNWKDALVRSDSLHWDHSRVGG